MEPVLPPLPPAPRSPRGLVGLVCGCVAHGFVAFAFMAAQIAQASADRRTGEDLLITLAVVVVAGLATATALFAGLLGLVGGVMQRSAATSPDVRVRATTGAFVSLTALVAVLALWFA
jgi:hypothetical protein